MQFETQRLIIRKPVIEDAEDIFRNYAQDPDVTKYLIWRPHARVEVTRDWVQYCIDSFDPEKQLPFVIWHKAEQQTIGMVDFSIHDFRVHFGYVLAKAYWNKGIMTEAAKPVVEMLLARKGIYRIEAVHDVDNPASGRVMQKLGMEYEGILKRYSLHPNISQIPRDCRIYAVVK